MADETVGTPEEQQGGGALLEALRSRIDVSGFQSDDDALAAIEEALRRPDPDPELEKAKPYLSEYAANAAEFAEWQRQRAEQQKQPEQPPAPEKKKWGPPQLSETAQRVLQAGLVERDPSTGVYKASSPEFSQYAREIQEAEEWKYRTGNKLVEKPIDTLIEAGLWDVLDEKLSAREQKLLEKFGGDDLVSKVAEAVRQQLMGEQQKSELQRHFDEHKAVYFKMQNGQPVLDPRTRQPALTEYGQKYAQTSRYLIDTFGQQDEAKLHSAIVNIIGMPPEVEGGQPEDKKQAFLDRAASSRKKANGSDGAEVGRIARAASRESVDTDDETLDSLWDTAVLKARRESVH